MPCDEIQRILEAKAVALVRRAADDLSALMDPDFVYVNAKGVSFDKAAYVEAYCVSGQILFMKQAFKDLEVRSFPSFAVATLSVDDTFDFGGQTIERSYRSLCVFREFDGRWLWAAGQTMAVT